MRGLDLALRFLLLASTFQGAQLILGENQVLLGRLRFQRLEPFAKALQVVPQPDAPHSGGGKNNPRLVSSLATRTCPNAGFSSAISTTAFSTCSSTRFLGQGLRRLISRNASSPPFSYSSLKR